MGYSLFQGCSQGYILLRVGYDYVLPSLSQRCNVLLAWKTNLSISEAQVPQKLVDEKLELGCPFFPSGWTLGKSYKDHCKDEEEMKD